MPAPDVLGVVFHATVPSVEFQNPSYDDYGVVSGGTIIRVLGGGRFY